MPMIMDHDLDDLFGDTAPLPLAPPSPPVRGLLQRVDELRSSGCCQKVAWSKIGCIAYITPDGRGVHLSNLRCNSKDGIWEHTEGVPIDHVSTIYNGRELAHISWNSSGLELAVVDVFGRLSLFSIFIALNRIAVSRSCIVEPEDNLSALVGLMWLNTDRMVQLYRSATNVEGQWNYPATQHKAMPPYNPSGKSAMLAITRGGAVRLVFQSQDSHWHDTKVELEGFSTSSDILTHASLCPDEGDKILLAVHTTSKQLRLYRVTIEWNQSSQRQQTVPAQLLPTFHFQDLKMIDNCLPANDLEGSDQLQSSIYVTPASYAQLSHLELLPQRVDVGHVDVGPTILAVFSHIPQQYHNTGLRDEPFSVVSRWILRSEKLELHPSFDQLGSKKSNPSSSATPKQELILKRMGDNRIERLVVGLQQLNVSTVLATSYSDGHIEFRDRGTIEVLPFNQEFDRVSSLGQIGFSFFDVEPSLYTALSPNACAKVSLSAVHVPQMSFLQMSGDHLTDSLDSSLVERIITAFVLHSSMASMSNNNTDDLLKVMELFARQLPRVESSADQLHWNNIQKTYLNELYRALGVNLDRSIEAQAEKLLRHPMIQRCFSIQASLGYIGEEKPRSLPSKLAWTLLNQRMISMIFAYAFIKSGPESDLFKPEVLQSMPGLAAWLMSLMNYIVDELFELNEVLYKQGIPFNLSFIQAKIQELNCPALPLILISSSRTLLKYTCRGLRGLASIARSNLNSPLFRDLDRVFSSCPVSASQFETILAEVDNGIRKAYQAASASGALTDYQRQELEKDMLVSASLPEILSPVVEHLLTTTMENLKQDVDTGELYFLDISWLGLSDDKRSMRWKKEHLLDAVRKVEIGGGHRHNNSSNVSSDKQRQPLENNKSNGSSKLRRCTRCCAVMEDLLPVKGGSLWMLNMQRTCFCGGFWVVE